MARDRAPAARTAPPNLVCPDCGEEKSPAARRCRPCHLTRRAARALRAPAPPAAPAAEPWDDCPELFSAFVPHPPAGFIGGGR